MKVLIATDAHFFRLPDNTYWCKSVYSYDFWKRYLDVFEEVKVLSRVKPVDTLNEKCIRVDGSRVQIYEVPFFQGPYQLLRKYVAVQRVLKHAFDGCSCAIFRMPSQTAEMAYRYMPKGMPFAGEIVYCPMDEIRGSKPGLNRLLSRITSARLKRFCLKANGVAYVTQAAIQKYYPSFVQTKGADGAHFENYYSSITLEKSAFGQPRRFDSGRTIGLVLTDDAMNSDRKGERVMIQALKKVIDRGYKAKLTLIGDGTLKGSFQDLCVALDIADSVVFTGRLASAQEVMKRLEENDIYVLPTIGEGLPRGIIEAMALGMPVLSTPVGGIPEIIESKYLMEPMDAQGFANTICRLIDHPQELEQMSIDNYKKALEFDNNILQDRRNEFYSRLKLLSMGE